MSLDRRAFCAGLSTALAVRAVDSRASQSPRMHRTVALMFDSLIAPFWVTSLEIMRRQAAQRAWSVLEAVSNMDDNRQYSQVQSMLQRKVDGIIIIHTDDKAVIPAIRAANAANTPMVHFNRRPAPSDAYSVAVVADNRKIMRETVTSLVDKARARGGRYQAALLVGDLSDSNAVQRRAGFNDAINGAGGFIDVVAQIATEWNADKAFAGLSNALQAHPDINFLVSSSDFLTPQIEQALRAAGRWHRVDEPDHVLIAAFDGDSNAYAQLAAGYYDADGVQDLNYEVQLSFDSLERMWAGDQPPKIVVDPGFVVTSENLMQVRGRMWGYAASKSHSALAQHSLTGPDAAVLASGGNQLAGAAAAVPEAGWTWGEVGAATMLFVREFFSITTARDTLLALFPLTILVTGQTLVLLLGQIDLSMTSIMAIGSVAAASVMSESASHTGEGWATVLGICACLAAGAFIGIFNGLCAAFLRMQSFIATLAVMMMGGGAAVWYASSISSTTSIGELPRGFLVIGYGSIGGVPVSLLLCTVVLVGTWYLLSRTLMGRWIYAIGHNPSAARISGVPVAAVTTAVFALAGLSAAIAAIVYTSRVETGLPTLGQNMLLDIVGAAVIGGVSLFGGRGSVAKALAGASFLCLLDKSLQLLGLSLFLVLGIKGIAILAAATADVARQRTRA